MAADSTALLAYHRAVEGWHEYYLLAGTAAVTLMGLLFVSLSIHLERVTHQSGRHLEAMARDAFSSFLIVLFLSLMMLIPDVARRPLSFSLAAVGFFRGLQTLVRIRVTLAHRPAASQIGPRGVVLRFLFPLLGSPLMVYAGVALLRGAFDDGLPLISMSCVLLLADAARSSYALLMRTTRDGREAGAGPA